MRSANVYKVISQPLTDAVPDHQEVGRLVREFDEWIRQGGGRPFVEARSESYMDSTQCGACHARELKNWKATHHAGALNTLRVKNKDKDLYCLVCHVTGFGRPGGSTSLEEVDRFGGVQCMSCHAPTGEKHPGGKAFGPVNPVVCLSCHTVHQDPEFDYERKKPLASCVVDRD